MTADTFEAFLDRTKDRVGPEADPWTAAANDLFDELTARWELDLGDPVASSAFTVAAVRAGERPVLLRIAYPDGWFFDDHMRQIPDHYHLHTQPVPGWWRGVRRP